MSSAVLVQLSGCLQSFQPSMTCRILIIRSRTSSLEAELVSSAQRASWPVPCHSSGRNFSPLHSVRALPGTVAASRSGTDPLALAHEVSAIDVA